MWGKYLHMSLSVVGKLYCTFFGWSRSVRLQIQRWERMRRGTTGGTNTPKRWNDSISWTRTRGSSSSPGFCRNTQAGCEKLERTTQMWASPSCRSSLACVVLKVLTVGCSDLSFALDSAVGSFCFQPFGTDNPAVLSLPRPQTFTHSPVRVKL